MTKVHADSVVDWAGLSFLTPTRHQMQAWDFSGIAPQIKSHPER
jgi:hypothetical protein